MSELTNDISEYLKPMSKEQRQRFLTEVANTVSQKQAAEAGADTSKNELEGLSLSELEQRVNETDFYSLDKLKENKELMDAYRAKHNASLNPVITEEQKNATKARRMELEIRLSELQTELSGLYQQPSKYMREIQTVGQEQKEVMRELEILR